MKRLIAAVFTVLSLFAVSQAPADLVLTAPGVASTIDFTGFAGTGFTPTPAAGQLDSDTWSTDGFGTNVAFGGTGTTGDPARGSSTGGVTTGGVYSFDTGGGNPSLGVQPGGSDFTPGDFTLRLLNDTGQSLVSFDIDYDVFVLNNAARANSFNFEWSLDDSTYNTVGSLDVTSGEAADGSPEWVGNDRSTTISFGTPLADGAQFYMRWVGNDVSGATSRDEFGLDNISVTGNAVPEPGSLAILGLLGLAGLARRRRK